VRTIEGLTLRMFAPCALLPIVGRGIIRIISLPMPFSRRWQRRPTSTYCATLAIAQMMSCSPMAASAAPRRARRPLMINSGADRAHCFVQGRGSSMAGVQVSPNHEECTASAHFEYLRREGVTTDDGLRRIDAEHDSADDRAFADPSAVTAITLGSLGCR
jgi:hypothetical protein